MVNELCRTKMLGWSLEIANVGICKQDTVLIAMSYLDRFLSSDTPQAKIVIQNRKKYQLASMTTLYMAIKLFESYAINTATLVKLSRNSFTATEFVEMELAILSALKWYVHGPTVLSFLEHFFALVPNTCQRSKAWKRVMLRKSKEYAVLTLRDYYFVTQKPSTVAIAILSHSLKKSADCIDFLSRITTTSKIDLGSQDIKAAKHRVAGILIPFNPKP